MGIKIALAGNPNCGKTTMFNNLTGANQYVGNWPGVTVEKKEGKYKGNKEIIITDLPGVYSLSPYTPEEIVTRNYLLKENPDVVLDIVDSTNIERNLYLTTQIIETGIPVVVALNMADILKKTGDTINTKKLSEKLGCSVIEMSALKGTGTSEAVELAIQKAKEKKSVKNLEFSKDVEKYISIINSELNKVDDDKKRWYAIKLFERDEEAVKDLDLSDSQSSKIEETVSSAENFFDDDSESIITNERYEFIAKVIKECVNKKKVKMTTSDKIDKVVTNRFLALPIFVAVMFLVYFLSIVTVGTYFTDWANDGLFGDGWYLFGIGRSAYEDATAEYEYKMAEIDGYIAAAEEAGINVEAVQETLGDEENGPDQTIINTFLKEAAEKNITAKVDLEDEEGNVTETVTVTATLFEGLINAEEPEPSEIENSVWVPGIPVIVGGWLEKAKAPEWLNGLVLDGIIGGVGSVLGFIPQMVVLFLLLSILEDCGYMARIAFIMDRIFRRFGLSGKSFIPLLVSTGCGVPGIMATRTIENDKDRRMTIMTTTMIPCGAKLPVIALILGAMFPSSWWLSPLMYFFGIIAVLISAIILKKTKMFAGDPAPFVMELPQYHIPAPKGVLLHVLERTKAFIIKAGTIIFLACAVIWFLSNFGFTNEGFGMVEQDVSILAKIGGFIAPIFAPLGFNNWKSTVAAVSGLVAKENVVGTMGALLGVGAEAAEDDPNLIQQIQLLFPQSAAALSFLFFNLFCAPCFAAIGAIRREMASAKWTWFAIGYQMIFAYVISLMVYQFGALMTGDIGFGVGTVAAIIVLLGMLFLLFRKNPNKRNLRKISKQNMA